MIRAGAFGTGMHFENPPLIELIAELRWLPPGIPYVPQRGAQPVQIPVPLFANLGRSSEDLYTKFAGLVAGRGFVHSERVVPNGFPQVPFQPVYRYSKGGTQPGEPIFQLGMGVFSAHITPPYKSWDDFRPYVETGVEALLDARTAADHTSLIIGATVRYFDCFTETFLQGRSIGAFINEILGIEIKAPTAISRNLAPEKEITPSIQLILPLTDERQMDIALAMGQTPMAVGLIMNTGVTTSRPLQPTKSDVMQFLDGAHQVISDMFMDLTKKLHTVMKPGL